MRQNVEREDSDTAEENRMQRRKYIAQWILWLLVAVCPCYAFAQFPDKKDSTRIAEEEAQRRLTYYYIAALTKAHEDGSSMADLLQHCLEIDPTTPAANFNMALVYFAIGQDSIGLERMKTAVAHDPQNPTIKESLASAFMATRKLKEAISTLEDITKLQPKRTDILAQLFELYKSEGRTKDAIRTLDRIQTLQGNNTRIAGLKHALYLDLGDTIQAFEQLKGLCREFPYDATNYILLGDQYLTIAAQDSALAAYDKAERIDPKNTMLKTSRLQYPLLIGDTIHFREMRDSIVLDEQSELSLRINALGSLAREAFQDSTQVAHTEEVFRKLLSPEKPPIPFLQLYLTYKAVVDKADNEDLIPIMERILHVDPSHQETLQSVLQYYVSKNDIKRIESLCQSALIYHPSELLFHYFLSVSLAQQNRNQEAVTALTTAIRQTDEESRPEMVGNIYALLGDIQYEIGHEKAAFEAYDSCLTYTPDNIMCLNNYAYFLSLKGENLNKAEKMSYRTIKVEPDNKTYLDTYAWILFMQEDYTTARIYIEHVIDSTKEDSTLLADDATSSVVLEHAGDIYAQCGQTELAVRMWELAEQKLQKAKNTTLHRKIKKRKYIKK